MRSTGFSGALLVAAASLAAHDVSHAQASSLHGDVGLATYRTPAITATTERSNAVLPYLYADLGPWLARVDTFGYRMLPLGNGHLELVARVSFEGYRPENPLLAARSTPLPIGIGTFQETRLGAFIVYAFRDALSGGTFVDASYGAELDVGSFHVYPQIGIERRGARYVRRLYGLDAVQAVRSGMASYAPGSSTMPNAAIAVDRELTPTLKLTAQLRRRWLDRSVSDSPLVNSRSQTSGLLAVTRTFR